jgi:DNA-binding transcriptional ArsR family regulator
MLNVITSTPTTLPVAEDQARIFKALTHPARIAILNHLRDSEHCVCHLEAHLGLKQAYISQQLAVLRDAGLIQDRRDGWNIFYRVSSPKIFELLDSAARLAGRKESAISPADVDCPCPHCTSKKSRS